MCKYIIHMIIYTHISYVFICIYTYTYIFYAHSTVISISSVISFPVFTRIESRGKFGACA